MLPPHTVPAIARLVDHASFKTSLDRQLEQWVSENTSGKFQADQTVVLMRSTENPTVFGRIVKAMIFKGVYGGVEVGFCHRISEHLIGQGFSPALSAQDGTNENAGS